MRTRGLIVWGNVHLRGWETERGPESWSFWGEERFFTRNHRPQGLSIANLYRSAPVSVNIQLNVEFEGVNREEAI